MKKVFLLFVVIVISNCAFAQTSVKYRGEVDAGYSLGTGIFSIDRASIHTIQGVSIGKYFSTGIGIGAEYCVSYFDDSEFYLMAPAYLNVKGYLPVTDRFSPYVSMDAGVSVGISDEVTFDGLYFTPAIGVKFGHLKVQVGYNVLRVLEEVYEDTISLNVGSIQFKIGVMF